VPLSFSSFRPIQGDTKLSLSAAAFVHLFPTTATEASDIVQRYHRNFHSCEVITEDFS